MCVYKCKIERKYLSPKRIDMNWHNECGTDLNLRSIAFY